MSDIDYSKIQYPRKMKGDGKQENDFICYIVFIREEGNKIVVKVGITKDMGYRINTIKNYHKSAKLLGYCDNLNYCKSEERMESIILDYCIQEGVKKLDGEYLIIDKYSIAWGNIIRLMDKVYIDNFTF